MTSVLAQLERRFLRIHGSLRRKIDGDEREMESGLNFNQLICEFESRHPCQFAGDAERDYISEM